MWRLLAAIAPPVREALWGDPGFAQNGVYYQHVPKIAGVRRAVFHRRAIRDSISQ
jgi:hypothetical protein